MAGTLHLIPTATQRRDDARRDGIDGVVADVAPRGLPRFQPWNGVALRGGGGDARSEGECGGKGPRPDRPWPRLVHWLRGSGCGASRHGAAAGDNSLSYRGAFVWSRNLLHGATSPPAMGPHASRFSRPDALVVSDGIGTWCWFDVAAGAAGRPYSRSG